MALSGSRLPALALAGAVALLVAAPLGGCSDRSPAAVPNRQVQDDDGAPTLQQYASGQLAFGDPAKAGYAPVAEPDLQDQGKQAPVTRPVLRSPEQALAGMGTVRITAGVETLSHLAPVDHAPAAGSVPHTRDGNRRNDLGELVVLDDTAALACGDVEMALRQFDAGRRENAAEQLRKAAGQLEHSITPGITAWVKPLATIASNGSDVTTAVAFLTVCTDGGYEL